MYQFNEIGVNKCSEFLTQQWYCEQHFIILLRWGGIIKGDFIFQVLKQKISEDIK